jgi:hypothetical protein
MAIKKCRFCAEQIQEDARICKHCKRQVRGVDTSLTGNIRSGCGCIIIIFIIVVVILIVSMLTASY